MPWPIYHLVTIKVIKWYYQNLTKRGSKSFRGLVHRLRKLKFQLFAILKFTIVLWWIYSIVSIVARWISRILVNLLRLDVLVSSEFKQLYYRYLTLARYSSNYKSQSKIFEYLTKNYPPRTQYIVLSMDMDQMGAGNARTPYLRQLEELRQLGAKKKELLPFIFADPRRIQLTGEKLGHQNYLNYCKSVLGKKQFQGIKLYPALGYYPFDKNLIDLLAYATTHEIPVMTHCIRGTVFFRGKKDPDWNTHPIITYNKKLGKQVPIPLPQKRNYDFTTNFTHPLNYECLLNPTLLSSYLKRDIDLSRLKICLAHFGGTEEWDKYRSDAWNDYNNNISPIEMDEYLKKKNTLNHGSRRTIWWNASWLSIIYDLLVKYENTYTDVSFILYNEELFPMLKYLLHDDKVRHKILFGTDYYVVSQKGLDKGLYQKLRSYLGEQLFMLIAQENPRRYLRVNY